MELPFGVQDATKVVKVVAAVCLMDLLLCHHITQQLIYLFPDQGRVSFHQGVSQRMASENAHSTIPCKSP